MPCGAVLFSNGSVAADVRALILCGISEMPSRDSILLAKPQLTDTRDGRVLGPWQIPLSFEPRTCFAPSTHAESPRDSTNLSTNPPATIALRA